MAILVERIGEEVNPNMFRIKMTGNAICVVISILLEEKDAIVARRKKKSV